MNIILYFAGGIIQDDGCTNALQTWHRPPKNAPKELVNEPVDLMMNRRIAQKGGITDKKTDQSDPNLHCDLTNHFMESSINAGLNLAVHSSRNANMDGLANDHCYLAKSLYESTLDNINSVNIEKIADIERKTRDQNNSELWHTIRKSRMTASNIKHIITAIKTSISKGIPCSSNPAKLNFKRTNLNHIPQIKWGHDNEAKAFDSFMKTYRGTKEFRRSGIFIDPQLNFLAASPDGICCCHREIIEIKCPYSIRHDDPTNATCLNHEKQLKKSHQYYYQVQFQLFVVKAEICHFVIFTTKGIHHEVIPIDKQFVESLVPELVDFYKSVFCKEYCSEFGFATA